MQSDALVLLQLLPTGYKVLISLFKVVKGSTLWYCWTALHNTGLVVIELNLNYRKGVESRTETAVSEHKSKTPATNPEK